MENKKTNNNIIIGRNPVTEALRSGRDIDKILVGPGQEGSIKKIIGMAKDRGIMIVNSEKTALDRIAGATNHQGVIAYASAYEYKEVDDILALARERGEDPFIIILDGLEDPHNLGAIMRSAEGAGAHGVIIPKRR
ncbi:MAG: 23S rRNA (guanosine(2251)-2'-O)-methyltransferase RlmB, partial [Firmicutes bacterium]|nr:23S rRNA (guanosine(2251)-2'-O)-methyltransferase RlmB [Bacillota bacterium]